MNDEQILYIKAYRKGWRDAIWLGVILASVANSIAFAVLVTWGAVP